MRRPTCSWQWQLFVTHASACILAQARAFARVAEEAAHGVARFLPHVGHADGRPLLDQEHVATGRRQLVRRHGTGRARAHHQHLAHLVQAGLMHEDDALQSATSPHELKIMMMRAQYA